MLKYTIFIIVCAALFYQTLADAELQSGKDDVEKAFHELMAVIDKALTQANNTLNKAIEQVKAEAAKVEEKAKTELDKTLVPLRTKLDDLIAKAKAKGIDVTKCQPYVDKFSGTPDDLVHNLVDCFNKPLNQAQKDVNDALTNIQKIEQDLNSIDTDIDECSKKKKWKQAECYAKLLEKIAKDTKDAPEKISKDVADAVALVTTLIPDLELCGTNQLKKAGEDATQDVADFAVCAAIPVVSYI